MAETGTARHRRAESAGSEDGPHGAELDLQFAGRVGTFTFTIATDRWYWSPEIYRMYGYPVGEIDVTTDLWLSHHHPDDRSFTTSVLRRVQTTGLPFQCHHRMIDTEGRTHYMLTVGEGETGPTGLVEQVNGRLIDLTGS